MLSLKEVLCVEFFQGQMQTKHYFRTVGHILMMNRQSHKSKTETRVISPYYMSHFTELLLTGKKNTFFKFLKPSNAFFAEHVFLLHIFNFIYVFHCISYKCFISCSSEL